jgi:beta-aspartyl-peptidase (threonine type)
MEDDPVFNAGRGSALDLLGRVEMDASVMEKTDHVLVAGRGAERLAKAFRLENRNQITADAKRSWTVLRGLLAQEEVDYLAKTSRLVHEFPELISAGTVGAVAQDEYGNIAAGSSTGGLPLFFANACYTR